VFAPEVTLAPATHERPPRRPPGRRRAGALAAAAFVALLLPLAAGLPACRTPGFGGSRPAFPADVRKILAEAGENRATLEAVLRHYRDQGDSLKYAAALFLVRNMEGHSYVRFVLCDSAGAEIDFDVLDYPDYPSLLGGWKELEEQRGELDFKRKEVIRDLEAMTASLFVENIEFAFRAWRQKPWARHLSFADFCDYVLPYRGSNEPLESWRLHFLRRFEGLERRMQDPTEPLEAARLINQDLQEWFRFDPRFYYHPTDQGLSEMLENQLGRCEDMTNLTIYAMRANGLAVTSDYTPYWANTGNNHAWNAILDRRGEALVFMGAEAHPGEYSLSGKAAKIYRKTFAHQLGNLVFRKPEGEAVPPWLSGRNYVDVTADYMPVATVVVDLARPMPDSLHYAYLCVFNDGEWGALDWGEVVGGRVILAKVGLGIAYLAALYAGGAIVPAATPFILDERGEARMLAPDHERPLSLALTGTGPAGEVPAGEEAPRSRLRAGAGYELFYWQDAWVSVGRAVAGDEPLAFRSVPGGALYWLVEDDSSREERIFTYESDRQVWW